jgi:DNA topoisomerase-2
MIVEKQLTVSNRKKADIVVDLRKHKFRAFPKASKAKASGEDGGEGEEEEEEEEEAEVSTDQNDYDYLLGMPIWNLTREKASLVCVNRLMHDSVACYIQIERLRQQAQEKEKELLILLERTPKEMWNTDLDRFLEGWEVGRPCHLEYEHSTNSSIEIL